MAHPQLAQLLALKRQAEDLYYRLVLLAGDIGVGKTALLTAAADECGSEPVNVNLELSRRLLDLTPVQRQLRLPDLLDDAVGASVDSSAPVFLDNLELLFDAGLEQKPLQLLQKLSRNRTVVAVWSGTWDGKTLVYAEPDHPEYHCCHEPEALILAVTASPANG